MTTAARQRGFHELPRYQCKPAEGRRDRRKKREPTLEERAPSLAIERGFAKGQRERERAALGASRTAKPTRPVSPKLDHDRALQGRCPDLHWLGRAHLCTRTARSAHLAEGAA